MKILYSWLKEYVAVAASPRQLARDLTDVGFPLEKIEEPAGDAILDIDVTSNRGDCLCHLGMAREAAAIYGLPLLRPDGRRGEDPARPIDWKIRILDKDLCRRYCALIVTGIRVGPSPAWMQERLLALGQRPINNIVDITNYVLLELGHPLHAFDLDRLHGKSILVRRARAGETITTLDGNKRELKESMLVIADEKKAVALAGVMGGEESEISSDTSRILLESAHFHPGSVRRTAKALGMSTEASYRFERGTDIANAEFALGRCARLILELAGGECASKFMDAYPGKQAPLRFFMHPGQISSLTGTDIENEFARKRLESLEFEVGAKGKSRWQIAVPTFRNDVTCSADIVEEVARHFNYGNVPSTLGSWSSIGHYPLWKRTEKVIRETLCGFGFSEVLNTNFANESELKNFAGYQGEPLRLLNPLSEDDGSMRWNILPLLLRNCRTNFNHGNKDVRFFESAKTFYRNSQGQPGEKKRLALLATGLSDASWWGEKPGPLTFHHFKGTIRGLLQALGLSGMDMVASEAPGYMDDDSYLSLTLQGKPIGDIGKLAQETEELYKFKQPVFLADIDLEEIYRIPVPIPRFRPLSRFPSVIRDLSMVFDPTVGYNAIAKAAMEAGIEDLHHIEMIDRFAIPNDPAGKISVTLRLWYRKETGTLTQEEVHEYERLVVGRWKEVLGADLRS